MTAMPSRYRKSPRIEGYDYRGPLAVHLTFVTRQRKRLFLDQILAETCLASLEKTCQFFRAALTAYCLMPDHLHTLISIPDGVTVPQFVHRFKQASGFASRKRSVKPPGK